MPNLIPPEKRAKYLLYRQMGHSQVESARIADLSLSSGRNIEYRLGGINPNRNQNSPPVPYKQLSRYPRAALNDIGLFAKRYYGLNLLPFHYEDTKRVVEWLESPHKEFVVINIAPGTGKTTFYTRVLPSWLTCRDRSIRGILGSASHKLATRYTRILRSDFVRAHPIKHSTEDIQAGIACDATSTLARDFGKFRPDGQEDSVWRQDSFIVAQLDDTPVAEKEHTWEAFGKDTSVIGTRVPIAIWDDLYDPSKLKSPEVKQDLYQWWSQVAEARLEPRGLLLLVGQRIDPDDIYHYALQQQREDDDGAITPKYHHIIHRAHYDELCEPPATHASDAKPWPDGCLLYPKRLTWRDLSSIKLNHPDVYDIVYQQYDYHAKNVLVERLWVEGGIDPHTGEEFTGCWDYNRGLCQFPSGLTPPLYSFTTADPSPTRYWSIQWWLYHPSSQQRFLLDLHRSRMDAPDLLDWDHSNSEFTGIMDRWQQRSMSLGVPISHWIVEVNAAQKFLLQYDHVRRWRTLNRVMVVPHTTGILKTDAELGIPAMKEIWKHGMVRLPGATMESRKQVQPLVDEVLRYNTVGKQVGTDDCVMAQWFLEFNLPRLSNRGVKVARQPRPSWAEQWAR